MIKETPPGISREVARLAYNPKGGDNEFWHALHVLEGYRCGVLGIDDNPFSPGSPRALCWDHGHTQGIADTQNAVLLRKACQSLLDEMRVHNDEYCAPTPYVPHIKRIMKELKKYGERKAKKEDASGSGL